MYNAGSKKTIAKIAVIFLGTLWVDDMRNFLPSKCNQLLLTVDLNYYCERITYLKKNEVPLPGHVNAPPSFSYRQHLFFPEDQDNFVIPFF